MPPEIDDAALQQLLSAGLSQREISRRLDIPRTTLQKYLKRVQAIEVHRGTAQVIPQRPPGPPEVHHASALPAELEADLLEVVQWWRARKLQRVSPGGPRDTQRQTWHVDKQWIARVKELADTEGVPQAHVIDRIFRQYFEGG
jgi:Homeodomain-like domain